MAKNNTQQSGFSGQTATIAAAVGGLALGLLANAGRKAFMQGMDASYGQWDEILKAEHDATRMMFDKIEATSDDQKMKRMMLLKNLKHALSKHAHEEENVVYPAMRDKGLKDEADHLNHEHGYVKQYLYELGEMNAATSQWLDKVREFRTEIERHMEEEEEELFPQLRAKLGDEANKHVTAALNKEGYKLS